MPDLSCLFTTPPTCTRCVLVCQNRTCLKQGAAQVLAAFQAQPVDGVVVQASGCLGQCGSGPMVQIVPDRIWYWRVRSEEVAAVVQRHLIGGHPIAAMLYPPFHDRATPSP